MPAYTPFAEIDDWIRRGNGDAARSELHRIARRGVSAGERADFANLAWRAGIPQAGAKVLSPIVRGHGRRRADPSLKEIAEYAACLIWLGAYSEALALLRALSPADYAPIPLYESFALVASWNYADAIPRITAYLKNRELTSYQRLVGRVNLASALVYERHHLKAEALLRDLLHEASISKLTLALGTALELSAGNFIYQKRYAKALPFLERAEKELSRTGGLVPSFVRKWKAILAFLRDPEHRSETLDDVRAEAARIGHWETSRDCDRFEAIAKHDASRFLKLYFGTPFESFRRRLLLDFKSPPPIGGEFPWELGGGARSPITLSLETASVVGSRKGLKPGQLLHRLLAILASDFYRPTRVANIHELLYPDNHFNPVTSPAQVHIAIHRLRAWFKGARIPLELHETPAGYRLVSTAPCRILVRRSDSDGSSSPQLGRLRAAHPAGDFSAEEAAAALGTSLRTALRVLKQGQALGVVRAERNGRAVRYRWLRSER